MNCFLNVCTPSGYERLTLESSLLLPHNRNAMVLRVASLLAGLLSLGTPMTSESEQPQAKQVPNPPACSPTASIVSILVRDRAGAAVRGATVDMVRIRDGKSLGAATEMRAGSGEFLLLESDALQWIGASGARIRVRARAGRRSATAVIRVGRDASGCRIVILSGPAILTL